MYFIVFYVVYAFFTMYFVRNDKIKLWNHIKEWTPFITVYCFPLLRYDLRKLFASPRIPYLSNLSSNMSWSAVSNTFVRPIKILMALFPSSKMFLILSVNSTNANVVECCLWNPNWKSNNILFTSRHFTSLLHNNFSNILLRHDSKLIDL